MAWFVRAPAWQLFVALMGAFMVLPPVLMAMGLFDFVVVGLVLFFAIYAAWVGRIGIEANKRLGVALRKSPNLMLFGLCYGLFCMAAVPLLILSGVAGPRTLPAAFILQLTAMGLMVYCLWYASRQLTALRMGAQPEANDIKTVLVWMWLFPIGVWFLQPIVREALGRRLAD